MASIKKTRDTKCWHRCGEKGTLLHLVVGLSVGTTTMKTRTEDLPNLKNRITYDPAILLLEHIQKK